MDFLYLATERLSWSWCKFPPYRNISTGFTSSTVFKCTVSMRLGTFYRIRSRKKRVVWHVPNLKRFNWFSLGMNLPIRGTINAVGIVTVLQIVPAIHPRNFGVLFIWAILARYVQQASKTAITGILVLCAVFLVWFLCTMWLLAY